mmetsp:Transcript_71397/g.180201  ORF Transcript_71397/g.180201 Transcript_71397/m.180201 type:complete len:611 (-) Transcript_71397:195-2027(-)|eukprot:CAMPEP_0115186696 /NCGR_PEP_ID=MMETSP0270-20121206/10112_1 /TAXON_ID=71861 /ORGANISM="Scrippsiella trochoidea, Strain CCMP3099" /LENGTH=610 /DNA_ID=CAMNT_0002599823 /DNA_START=73 /DNA_END=1905 /DNA_ORIENTATION=-
MSLPSFYAGRTPILSNQQPLAKVEVPVSPHLVAVLPTTSSPKRRGQLASGGFAFRYAPQQVTTYQVLAPWTYDPGRARDARTSVAATGRKDTLGNVDNLGSKAGVGTCSPRSGHRQVSPTKAETWTAGSHVARAPLDVSFRRGEGVCSPKAGTNSDACKSEVWSRMYQHGGRTGIDLDHSPRRGIGVYSPSTSARTGVPKSQPPDTAARKAMTQAKLFEGDENKAINVSQVDATDLHTTPADDRRLNFYGVSREVLAAEQPTSKSPERCIANGSSDAGGMNRSRVSHDACISEQEGNSVEGAANQKHQALPASPKHPSMVSQTSSVATKVAQPSSEIDAGTGAVEDAQSGIPGPAGSSERREQTRSTGSSPKRRGTGSLVAQSPFALDKVDREATGLLVAGSKLQASRACMRTLDGMRGSARVGFDGVSKRSTQLYQPPPPVSKTHMGGSAAAARLDSVALASPASSSRPSSVETSPERRRQPGLTRSASDRGIWRDLGPFAASAGPSSTAGSPRSSTSSPRRCLSARNLAGSRSPSRKFQERSQSNAQKQFFGSPLEAAAFGAGRTGPSEAPLFTSSKGVGLCSPRARCGGPQGTPHRVSLGTDAYRTI